MGNVLNTGGRWGICLLALFVVNFKCLFLLAGFSKSFWNALRYQTQGGRFFPRWCPQGGRLIRRWHPQGGRFVSEMVPPRWPICFGDGTPKEADFFVGNECTGNALGFFADLLMPIVFSIKTNENKATQNRQTNRHVFREGFLEVFLQAWRIPFSESFSATQKKPLLVQGGVPPPP